MDEFVLDFDTIQKKQEHIIYGGFWPRWWASILDFLILCPLTIFLTFYNILYWKNFGVYILIILLSSCYKPLLEFKYGATYGKMAAKLKVVNMQMEKPEFKEILLRNILYIVLSFITLPDTYATFNTPGFEDFSSFSDYLLFAQENPGNKFLSFVPMVVVIIDGIFLISDRRKQSLHDKMGGTFVVKTA